MPLWHVGRVRSSSGVNENYSDASPPLKGGASCFLGSRPQVLADFPGLTHASTGSSGCSNRQLFETLTPDVDRGVVVPVMDGPAVGTGPGPNVQGQGRLDRPAARAGFTGGEPLPDLDEGLSFPGALVGDHGQEKTPSGVGNDLGQLLVLLHTLHVQAFSRYDRRLAFADDLMAKVVQEVLTDACHAGVDPCDQSFGLPAVVAALPLAGEGFLLLPQVPQGLLQVLGVPTLVARAGGDQIGQAKVDPQDGPIVAGGRRLTPVLGEDGNMVASGPVRA